MIRPSQLILLLFLSFSFGCTYPSSKTETVAERPGIAIHNAPQTAILYVDGQIAGQASQYDGKTKILLVEPGVHIVEVRSASGENLLKQKIFVESELKTIVVR